MSQDSRDALREIFARLANQQIQLRCEVFAPFASHVFMLELFSRGDNERTPAD